jgi:hypothetical protein
VVLVDAGGLLLDIEEAARGSIVGEQWGKLLHRLCRPHRRLRLGNRERHPHVHVFPKVHVVNFMVSHESGFLRFFGHAEAMLAPASSGM